jgi:hypothetical protein
MQVFFASIIFQVLWFVAVLGRDQWQWILLASVAILWLTLIKRFGNKVTPLIRFSLIGICVDSVNQLVGVLDFDTALLPLWLVGLWFLLAWYFVFLARFLNRLAPSFVPVLFMISGASSYMAAIALAAATHQYSIVTTAVILAIEWFLLGVVAIRVIGHVQTMDVVDSDSHRAH